MQRMLICVWLPQTTHNIFHSCKEEEDEAVLRRDSSLVVTVSKCRAITAPQAAWLNVF